MSRGSNPNTQVRRVRPAAPSPRSKKACLIALTGDLRGTRFEIGEGLNRIGRGGDSEIRLSTDEFVSRRHADLTVKDGKIALRDRGSTNGTYVNGEKIAKTLLRNGDRLHVGTTTLKFLHADDVEAAYLDEMYTLATRDGLTGVFNKRYFLEQFEKRFSESRRSKQPFAVLIIDLDRFKEVNDTNGHMAGDAVLQEVCTFVQSLLRKEDVLARFGGEEFVILAPKVSPDGAVQLGEKIRHGIESHPIAFGAATMTVTVSVGIWSGHPEQGMTCESVLKNADTALYKAKKEGRNACSLSGESGSTRLV